MASTVEGSIEQTVGSDLSTVQDFLEQYGSEEVGSFIPGDSFAFPGLAEKPGLTFIEAKAEEMPDYDDRDSEVYDDYDAQITVIAHADTGVYGSDDESQKTILSDVNAWIVGEENEYIKVLNQEIVRSEPTFHEVKLTILVESYCASDFIGGVIESTFNENFWNKHMRKPIKEGVCYVKDKVPDELEKKLKANIDDLAKKIPIDYHPKSNDIVRDLVHPALYPYIRGVSKFKKDAHVPTDPTEDEANDFWGRKYEDSKFQWLPTPFKITNDRKCKIQEYINNLDRESFSDLYENLEKLFEVFLPYFEEVWAYSKAVEFFTGDDDDDEGEPFNKETVSFTGQELQVIVKVVEYSLQPDQSYEGVWHAEGMSHENIVMTGIYFMDRSSALSGGDLRFKRGFTKEERSSLFGKIVQQRPVVVNDFASEGFIPLGHFPTEEGYLLVFPNCHIHKISKMVNTAQKEMASRRIVVFFFINPEKTIISTREIAHQQGVISLPTAKEYRLELMAERKYDKEKLNVRDIELCEH